MVRRTLGLLAAVLALAGCAARADESPSVTVVLFDVSNSTRDGGLRARYERTFGMVLDHVREAGGVLGADVIDDDPLAHGSLPINVTFEPCTITENSLECREGLEEQTTTIHAQADAILEASSFGTDVFGGLALAEQFFQAYPDAGPRTLVLLSDMVQSANGIRLRRVRAWTEEQVSAYLARSPSADLRGVRVYVVGAGATAQEGLTPAQIEGIERFWTRWFQEQGASVVFYGANLARFPIPEATAPGSTAPEATA